MTTTFKGIMGQKAMFDGEMVTITKRGQTRTFYIDEITTILTSRGRFEFGLKGEETAASSSLSWNKAKQDVHNTRVINHNSGKKKSAEAEEFVSAIRTAQRAARD